MTMAAHRADWFSKWVVTLAEQRFNGYGGTTPPELEALRIVRQEILPRLSTGQVAADRAFSIWRETMLALSAQDLNPQTMFFAIRFTNWMGGVVMGCCAGFETWIATRPAVLNESEVSAQLTRIFCRMRKHLERDSESQKAYGRLLDAMATRPYDVAALTRVTDRLIRETKSPSPATIVACDNAWHLAAGYHEGAWMTLGMIRNAPPQA